MMGSWQGLVIACPDGQYSSMGMCWPEIGGSVGQATEHLKREIPAQLGGNPLEAWINASRSTSVQGAMPIPPQIRQALTGYIDQETLNAVRFKIGDNGVLNLAGLSVRYGDVSAITLIDVVVFRDANDAYSNPALWAHELKHVKQFRDWGTHSFAIQYARDYVSVERPAYEAGNNYAQWKSASSRMPTYQYPQPRYPPVSARLPSGAITQACGCWGPTTGWNPDQRCASGGIHAIPCNGLCLGNLRPYFWVCQ